MSNTFEHCERDDAIQELRKKVDKLDQVVFLGNGQPSLKEQIAELKKQLNIQSKLIWLLVAQVLAVLFRVFFKQ